jgi:hypothetical protein
MVIRWKMWMATEIHLYQDGTLQVVSKKFPWHKIVVNFFFQGRDILWHIKATKIYHSVHKSMVREEYTYKLQVVLKHTFFGHPCNPCWYPLEW